MSTVAENALKGSSDGINGVAHIFLTASNFDASRVHHLCFRARERADVDTLHDFLNSIETTIIRAPREDEWAPGYYSILFDDPDGIRLELNYLPGKGLLT